MLSTPFPALGLAVLAVILRLLPGRGFALGPVEFTPATACALVAVLVALGSCLPGRAASAARLIRFNDQPSPVGYGGALAVIIAAGAAMRLAHLGEFPLNGDEHLFVNTAHAGTLEAVWRGIMEHHHPPANFYLLHFLQGFSVHPVWLRLPSVLSGIFLIWIAARFVRECGGPLEALVLALLVALSPALIELSRVCRNYAPASALMMTALFFFVRYMRSGRLRDVAMFSLFEMLTLTWLYTMAIPFFAANLVLFGRMALQKRPAREWVPPFAIQLPVAGLLIVLYLTHIRIVSSGGMSELIAEMTIDQVMRSPLDYLLYLPLPMLLLFQYLLAGMAGLLMSMLALTGAIQLWVSGRRWMLAFCLLPFPVSYLFGFAGLLPLGGNRQSSYLFPFVFVLVAASAPALLTGLDAMRRRLRASGSANPASDSPAVAASGGGFMALLAVLGLFFYLSMGIQEGTVFLDRQVELPTSYAELDRTLDLLAEKVKPGDIVLVSFQGLVAYHAYENRTAMPYHPAENFAFEVRGMRFHYSTEAGWFFSPESLIRAYADVRIREGLGEVERVWTVRGAGVPWEETPRDWFNYDFPEVPKDDSIYAESGGWLFTIRAEELTKLVPLVADDPEFYASDFTRTQFPPEAHHEPEYFLQLVPAAGDAGNR